MCSKYTNTISIYTHLPLCPSKSGSNWSSSLLLLSQSVLSLLWFIYFCRKAKQGKVEATESNLARPKRMTHSLPSPWGRPCKHYTWRPSERQTGPLSCEVVVFCCWWSRIFCLQAEGKEGTFCLSPPSCQGITPNLPSGSGFREEGEVSLFQV